MPPNKYATLPILIFFLAITHINSQVSFAVSSASASPNTAGASSSQYQIQLNPITTFSTNFDISLTFLNTAFSITTPTSCTVTLNGSPLSTPVCSLSSNSIIFSQLNIATTITSLSLGFSTSSARYSGSFITTISYY